MKTLETERLILRSFKPEDVDDLYAYASDPAIGPAAGWKPHGSPEESQRILRMFLDEDEVWAIEHKETHRVIGSIGLHTDGRRHNKACRALGYVLAQRYWGEGLMPEAAAAALRFAFEELGLELVTIYHYPFNNRSRRVIEKLGFRHEGTLRQATTLFDGTVQDDVCYSMTRSEWEYIVGEPTEIDRR